VVIDGLQADLLIVAAREGGEARLFLVRGDAAGVERRPRRMADSRGYADVRFENAPAEPLGGPEVLPALLDRAYASLAAEMLGSAAQAFETTLDYLKTRTQFGQLIGGFQALQHRAAQMFVELELARSCVEAALAAADAGAADLPALASLAKARANDAFHRVSNEMVQMHGGIGMTDEHDAGFYLKRARTAEALFGASAFHRDRYARLMGF
jgi:alkylation response protein AidB-like acyl-CoA dehydrogenase